MDCFKKMADINWSFWSTFLVVVLFILFIAVGIMQSFCYIVTANGMKDPKIYIFLGIILVGIIICLILFHRIYSLLLLYNDMEKRKTQSLIERYKEDNINKYRTINNLRNQIYRLQDLLSDDVFKKNHNDMAKIYTHLGELFIKLDRIDEGEKLFSNALVLYKSLAKEAPNEYNESVANTYCRMAEILIKKNQNSAAKKNYEKAIEYYIKVENADHNKFEGIVETSKALITLKEKDDSQKINRELFQKVSEVLKNKNLNKNDILTKIENFLNKTE